MSSQRPEFVTDSMLKGLGTWLRFLGYSTVRLNSFAEVKNLLRLHSGWIFITASTRHFQEIGDSAAFLVKADRISAQLQELNERFHIFQNVRLFSLCSCCNIPLQSISREGITQQIPEQVKQSFHDFWICPGCQRIYWQGGHIQRLLEKMQRMGIPI